MRVISGSARGRTLKAVPGMGTRPTTDKVKEALFSMIGPYFEGGTALDLFAGSGGLGIEALSRGMERAIFVDADKKAVEIVHHNLEAAGLASRAEVYRNDAQRALKALQKRDIRFALVLLDPPYKLRIADELIAAMQSGALLEDGATIVVEHGADYEYPDDIAGCRLERLAEYGDTAVRIYRNMGSKAEGE